MTRQLVGSRDYKVMLRPEKFAGTGDESRWAVDAFWTDMRRILEGLDIPTEGAFAEVKAHRRIRFFDTAERSLNGQRYIFREGIDVEREERQVTLKSRHADRYVAQDRDMDPRSKGDDAETKFEEDVKPPFVSVLSYSTSVTVDPTREFQKVDDIAESSTPPVCVEFSFKYGNDDEDYSGTVARDAHDVLEAIHTKLPDWVHPEPVTRTTFIYQWPTGRRSLVTDPRENSRPRGTLEWAMRASIHIHFGPSETKAAARSVPLPRFMCDELSLLATLGVEPGVLEFRSPDGLRDPAPRASAVDSCIYVGPQRRPLQGGVPPLRPHAGPSGAVHGSCEWERRRSPARSRA